MARRLVVLCVVAVCFCQYMTDGRALTGTTKSIWRDCTSPNSPMKVTNLKISPNPIFLPGEILFTMEGYSNRTIGSSTLQFEIVRKLRNSWFDSVRIPCLFKIGSCTYPDVCVMLDEMSSENWAGITSQLSDDIRDMLMENNMNPDVCPQPPQQISIIDHRLPVPRIPSFLAWFAEGLYNAHVTLTDNSNGEELQCFEMEMEVKLPQEECDGWFCMFG